MVIFHSYVNVCKRLPEGSNIVLILSGIINNGNWKSLGNDKTVGFNQLYMKDFPLTCWITGWSVVLLIQSG